ncbi:MAG: glycosyltransferase [Akkermansiaceae bacterium]|nr:glycosyltransferase [Akkermansiaceae bacterium]
MRLLLVFLKEPVAGEVKTRLAADVGHDDATRYYKALVEVLLRQLQGLHDCRIRFCYTPDDADDAVRFWLLPAMRATSSATDGLYLAPSSMAVDTLTQEVDFRPQGAGNLGERLHRAFGEGFANGFSEISVIGSDCPECGARWINAAFSRLASASGRDVIIGPSNDGGYYLLALKAPAPGLFRNIPWSSKDVFDATSDAAVASGLSLETLPMLSDVDDLTDWNRILAGPLGAALKKALGEPLDETLPACPQGSDGHFEH